MKAIGKKWEVILRMSPIRNFKPGENGVIYSKYKKKKMSIKTYMPGTSLMVLWLRLHTQNRGPDLIPGHRTRTHVPQLKIPYLTQTWHSQNK